MSSTEETPKAFDWFELMTALLLGLAAIGCAWASHQNGQWGGRQAEAFAEASTMSTKAGTSYNEQSAVINHDYSIDLQAKKLILEAIDSEDEKEKERLFTIASNLYTRYMSTDAYEDLDLPLEFITPNEVQGKEQDFVEAKPLPAKVLIESVEAELGDEYITDMLASPTADFANADKRFAEGRQANETGDQFSLIQVFYTISLFFAGLGLVFKTNIRWGFLGAGTVVLIYASVLIFRYPWA